MNNNEYYKGYTIRFRKNASIGLPLVVRITKNGQDFTRKLISGRSASGYGSDGVSLDRVFTNKPQALAAVKRIIDGW